MVLFYGAANRDPRVLVEPERFRGRPDPNPRIRFGGPGPRFCLGAHLARSLGIPLVGGVKHLPVRFTPSASAAH